LAWSKGELSWRLRAAKNFDISCCHDRRRQRERGAAVSTGLNIVRFVNAMTLDVKD
jgi:hypothetical protein